MVIFCAVGGRTSLYGAIYGTLLVNTGKSLFSETFPQLWLFAMGGLFIAVVVLFPDGLAGVFELVRKKLKPWLEKFRNKPSLPVGIPGTVNGDQP
jgi:urea transport system permease protein